MPIVLGIAGGTASGKSTVAAGVARHLGDRCLWVTHDRYYRSVPAALSHDPMAHNFDHPDALDNGRLVADLEALKRGRGVRLPVYDFATHQRAPEAMWDAVQPRPVVLVEGILILAVPTIRAQIDRGVFVDAPESVRLARRIERDMADRGREREEIIAQFARTVQPMHAAHVAPSRAHAQLQLDGTTAPDALVRRVLTLLGEP